MSILREIRTTDPADGDDDFIFASNGSDVVLGGSGNDRSTPEPTARRRGGWWTTASACSSAAGVLVHVETTNPVLIGDGTIMDNPAFGGDDEILTGNGPDVVFGGSADDDIDAGTDASGDSSADVVVGDNGFALFTDAGVLFEVRTIEPQDGGDDEITTGGGPDLVLGGSANDDVQAGAGADLVLGDNGQALLESGIVRIVASIDREWGGEDQLFGNTGEDILSGGAAGDVIDGDEGRRPDLRWQRPGSIGLRACSTIDQPAFPAHAHWHRHLWRQRPSWARWRTPG